VETDGASRALEVPARAIPIPASVSAAARQRLARAQVALPSYPALDDLAGWRAMVAAIDGQILAAMTAQAGASTDAWADTEPVHVGADVFVITPPPVDDADQRVYLDVHGGAMILRGGQLCRADQIIVGGSSAGANLAAAMIPRARDEGLPLPAAAILLTPHLDLKAPRMGSCPGHLKVRVRALSAGGAREGIGHKLPARYRSGPSRPGGWNNPGPRSRDQSPE
jgi:acetyl esterase/lipase